MISQLTENVLSTEEPIEINIEISSREYRSCVCVCRCKDCRRHIAHHLFVLFSDGKINVYRDGKQIVEAFDQNPLDVAYVRLGSLDREPVDFYYNCRANDGSAQSDRLKEKMIAFASAGSSPMFSDSNALKPNEFLLRGVVSSVVFLFVLVKC